MRKVCAWCDAELAAAESDERQPISHGICEQCLEEALDTDTSLFGLLNRLHVPVAAVDAEGRLVTASNEACAMLGQTAEQMAGQLGGDVFACVRAKLPGGCGKTVHCLGCTVRRTVMATHATVQSQARVPAYLDQRTADGQQRLKLAISTEKLGAVVMLRIDDIRPEAG